MFYIPPSSSGSSALSGTLATMLATTPAAGTTFWNTTYGAMFVYVGDRWILSGKPDPRYGYNIEDDFLSNTTTTGSIGWNTSGTIAVSLQASNSHPGVFTVRQATAGTRSSIGLRNDAISLSSAMDMYIEYLVQIPTLATGAEDFCVTVGLNDNAAYDVNGIAIDGAYFSYNRAANGANWNTHTVSNSVATNTTNLTSAIVAGTWYRLGILITGTTSVDFYVNGTNIKQHTTNIPSGATRATGYQVKMDKTLGSANSDIQIDYFSSWAFFTTPRGT